MQLTKKFFLVIILFSAAATACRTEKSAQATAPAAVKADDRLALPEKERLRAERLYIDAARSKILGDIDEAKQQFEQVTKIDPYNAAAHYELASLYLKEGKIALALANAQKAAELEPGNKWFQKMYAEALAESKEYKLAAQVYRNLLALHPGEYEFYLDLAFMYMKGGEADKAIEAFDELERQVGINENITLQKQQLYLSMGKVEKAAGEIRKLIDAFPSEVRYYGMLAELYEANNMQDKAAELYKEILKRDPDNPQALLSLADIYQQQGKSEEYKENVKKVLANPEMDIDAKIRLLFSYINQINDPAKREEGLAFAKIVAETHPEEAKAFAMYGDLLYNAGQPQEAKTQYHKALELDNSRFTVWQQLLAIDAEQEQYDSLLLNARQAKELFPNQVMVYYFEGLAHLQLKDHEEGIKSLERATQIGTDNQRLLSQIYSLLGDAYHEVKNDKASDEAYEKALELDPDNAFVLNNYSYYLSERQERLEEAARMSEKANKLMPGNSSFQDTYGWILYRQARYEEAREWLEKAMQNGGSSSPVILEHYGDVLFNLNEVDKAVEYWKKAKSEGAESDVLEKKIKNRRMYE